MIKLNNYITNNTVILKEEYISESLRIAFDNLINNNSLVFETVENTTEKNKDFLKNVLTLKNSIQSFGNIDDISNEEILNIVTDYIGNKDSELQKEYDNIIKKWFDKEAIKDLDIKNTKEITKEQITTILSKHLINVTDAYKKDKESHEGNTAVNNLIEQLNKYNNELVKKLEEYKEKAKKEIKTKENDEKYKTIIDEFRKAAKEWKDALDDFGNEYKNVGSHYITFEREFNIAQTSYVLDTLDNNEKREEKLKEYIKLKNDTINKIKETAKEIENNAEKYDNAIKDLENSNIDTEHSEEAQTIKDNEESIINSPILSLVLNEFKSDNIIKGDIKNLQIFFNELVNTIDDSSNENVKAKNVLKDVSKTTDSNAFIGLTLMILSSTALYSITKKPDIITQFGGAISNNIQNSKFNKLFDSIKGE